MILRRRGYKMAAPKNHVNLSQNDPAMKEMLKPLIFGNYQKMFGIFTFIVSAGLTYYMVFRHDYGEKRHCFSWLREYTEDKKQRFFSISPDDKLLVEKRNKKLTTTTNE